MKRLFFALFMVLILMSHVIQADVSDDRQLDVQGAILGLHAKEGPARDYIIWGECGKRLRKDQALARSAEYAKAIVESVDVVEKKTGEQINLDYMVAILFRESSHDECVIGKQETGWLTEQLGRAPDKREIIGHVREWTTIYRDAKRKCKEKGLSRDIRCIGNAVGKVNPHYRGIHGWDLGAAQYRWPGYNFRRRMLTLPTGRIVKKVGLNEIFDYEVSVHMLAEDLAKYRRECQEHTHWLTSRWGKRLRKLDPEEAYFVHHHTGGSSWSGRYWEAVNKHLNVIRDNREKLLSMGSPVVEKVAMAN